MLELELGVVAQRGRDVEVVGGAHGQRQLAEGVLQFDDSLAEASYGLGLIEARQGQMAQAANRFARAGALRARTTPKPL